jgi:hypothetical protein
LDRVKRRPSLATCLALLALFVALGGPAQASRFVEGKLRSGSVTSAQVKDHSLKTRDLSRKTVRDLRETPNGSITEVKIANGAVTNRKLAPGSVGTSAIADRSVGAADLAAGSVTGTQVADGSLDARDLGRFSGRFQLANAIPVLHAGQCWSGVPADLAAERAKVDISNDLVIVTPDATWPQEKLSFMVKLEPVTPKPGRFTLAACNVTSSDSQAFRPSFRYAVIDLP